MNFRSVFCFSPLAPERIAKKLLLVQIKADYSSAEEVSTDEETEEEESDNDEEQKERIKDENTDGNGESFS